MNQDPMNSVLKELPRSYEPVRDLWPGIERALDRPVSPPTRSWALAASILLSIVLGAGLGVSGGYWFGTQQQNQTMVSMLTVMSQQHEDQLKSSQSEYQIIVNQEKQPISEGLETLRNARNELFQSLMQDPSNTSLLELWLWVQQRETELISEQKLRHQRYQQRF